MNAFADGDPKLDDVLLFNDYLLKLVCAGVPIGLDGKGATEDLLDIISKINSSFAMGVAKGDSVRQILESSQELPCQYRSALSTWLFCDQSPDALKALNDCASGRRDMQKLLGFSMLQPLILSVLVYLGFLLTLLYLAPKINAISQQMHASPGLGLRFLTFATQTMWLWSIAVPLLISLGFCLWLRYRSEWSYLWLPGRQGIADLIGKANYADSVANLIEHNFSEVQARTRIGSLENHVAKVRPMPPMLQWAFGSDVGNGERANALHASASAYRNLAQSRLRRLNGLFPVLFSAVLGGALVLLYGLSLFGPMIELLHSLSHP